MVKGDTWYDDNVGLLWPKKAAMELQIVCVINYGRQHIILVDFLYKPLSDLKVAIDGKTINLETDGPHNNSKYHIISSTTLFQPPRKHKKKHTKKSPDSPWIYITTNFLF